MSSFYLLYFRVPRQENVKLVAPLVHEMETLFVVALSPGLDGVPMKNLYIGVDYKC